MGFDVSGVQSAVYQAADNVSDEVIKNAKSIDDKIIAGEDGTTEMTASMDRMTRAGINLERVAETATQTEAQVEGQILQQ